MLNVTEDCNDHLLKNKNQYMQCCMVGDSKVYRREDLILEVYF